MPCVYSSRITASLAVGFLLPRRVVAIACVMTALGASLAAADQLRGQVIGPDGQPVAGAQVTVSGALAAPATATADADGRFVVTAPAGTVTVRAFAPGMSSAPLSVQSGNVEIRVVLAVRAVDETLTVTASLVEAPLSSAPDSVTVIPRADLLARQTTTLGDALRLVPGFSVARSGGPGTVTSVFPRGGESDFTLVLVDGVRANAFGGGLDLSEVPIGDVDRIEVVRGPQSALHGSDAIGGVVQLITARGGPLTAFASSEAGGRKARTARGSVRGSAGPWYGGASTSYDREEGFTGPANDGTTVSNDDGYVAQVAGTLGWRLDSGTDVAGTVQFVETERGSPGAFGSNPAGNFGGVDRLSRGLTRRRSGGLRVVQPLGAAGSRTRLRVEADVADFDLEFRSRSTSQGETQRQHARVQVDTAITPGLSASVGGAWLSERGRSTFITAGPVTVPIERSVVAAFAEGRWQPMARVAISAGARVEHVTRSALAADPSAFSPRPAFPNDTVTVVNPKVTATWTARPESAASGMSTRLRAAAGTGIRPPDAFEIAFTDNPGLKPERSRSVEAGVTQTLRHGALQADVTWFHNSYDDLIISVGRLTASSRFRTDNIANARARGAEMALAWRPSAAFSARGTYTWLDAEVLAVDGANGLTASPFNVGDRLLRRPRHQGSADVIWNVHRLQTFATASLRGTTLDVEPNFGSFGGLFENRGHVVVTTGAAFSFGRSVTAYARVANLFGANYEDVFGFPALGRTAYLGLRLAARH